MCDSGPRLYYLGYGRCKMYNPPFDMLYTCITYDSLGEGYNICKDLKTHQTEELFPFLCHGALENR